MMRGVIRTVVTGGCVDVSSKQSHFISSEMLRIIASITSLAAAFFAFIKSPFVSTDAMLSGMLCGAIFETEDRQIDRMSSIRSLFVTAVATTYVFLSPSYHVYTPFLLGVRATLAGYDLLFRVLS
ncbi:MAG: hypothetical protein HY861_03975 [Chlamydiia bacterium]|nr:hypothetical protein [Chlamydiia bacterium]